MTSTSAGSNPTPAIQADRYTVAGALFYGNVLKHAEDAAQATSTAEFAGRVVYTAIAATPIIGQIIELARVLFVKLLELISKKFCNHATLSKNPTPIQSRTGSAVEEILPPTGGTSDPNEPSKTKSTEERRRELQAKYGITAKKTAPKGNVDTSGVNNDTKIEESEESDEKDESSTSSSHSATPSTTGLNKDPVVNNNQSLSGSSESVEESGEDASSTSSNQSATPPTTGVNKDPVVNNNQSLSGSSESVEESGEDASSSSSDQPDTPPTTNVAPSQSEVKDDTKTFATVVSQTPPQGLAPKPSPETTETTYNFGHVSKKTNASPSSVENKDNPKEVPGSPKKGGPKKGGSKKSGGTPKKRYVPIEQSKPTKVDEEKVADAIVQAVKTDSEALTQSNQFTALFEESEEKKSDQE